MSQNQRQDYPWVERKERQTGLEVDEYGYPILSVVFYDSQPDNVVTETVPDTLNNPCWSFKQKQWIEG